ncbi:MAG: hypothetical protein ACU0CO_11670 [Shimia sp.]
MDPEDTLPAYGPQYGTQTGAAEGAAAHGAHGAPAGDLWDVDPVDLGAGRDVFATGQDPDGAAEAALDAHLAVVVDAEARTPAVAGEDGGLVTSLFLSMEDSELRIRTEDGREVAFQGFDAADGGEGLV